MKATIQRSMFYKVTIGDRSWDNFVVPEDGEWQGFVKLQNSAGWIIVIEFRHNTDIFSRLFDSGKAAQEQMDATHEMQIISASQYYLDVIEEQQESSNKQATSTPHTKEGRETLCGND